jgi:hypothetical protein
VYIIEGRFWWLFFRATCDMRVGWGISCFRRVSIEQCHCYPGCCRCKTLNYANTFSCVTTIVNAFLISTMKYRNIHLVSAVKHRDIYLALAKEIPKYLSRVDHEYRCTHVWKPHSCLSSFSGVSNFLAMKRHCSEYYFSYIPAALEALKGQVHAASGISIYGYS